MNAFLKHCSLSLALVGLALTGTALALNKDGGDGGSQVYEDYGIDFLKGPKVVGGGGGGHGGYIGHGGHSGHGGHAGSKQPHEIVGDVLNQMSGGFGEFIGANRKEAPLAPKYGNGPAKHNHQHHHTEDNKKPEVIIGSPGPSATTEVIVKDEDKKKDFFGLKKAGEFLKLLLNPFELCKAIASHFKLPIEKFVELIGKGVIFGTEAALTPLVVTLKIIEKVFVPDACRLKFICRVGSHLDLFRDRVLKFSPHLLEGSSHIKALTDGIVGRDCEVVFTSCEPKLKKPFDELKGGDHHHHHNKGRSVDDSKAISGISSSDLGDASLATASAATTATEATDAATKVQALLQQQQFPTTALPASS